MLSSLTGLVDCQSDVLGFHLYYPAQLGPIEFNFFPTKMKIVDLQRRFVLYNSYTTAIDHQNCALSRSLSVTVASPIISVTQRARVCTVLDFI